MLAKYTVCSNPFNPVFQTSLNSFLFCVHLSSWESSFREEEKNIIFLFKVYFSYMHTIHFYHISFPLIPLTIPKSTLATGSQLCTLLIYCVTTHKVHLLLTIHSRVWGHPLGFRGPTRGHTLKKKKKKKKTKQNKKTTKIKTQKCKCKSPRKKQVKINPHTGIINCS